MSNYTASIASELESCIPFINIIINLLFIVMHKVYFMEIIDNLIIFISIFKNFQNKLVLLIDCADYYYNYVYYIRLIYDLFIYLEVQHV